ncbi:MAG: phospholipase D-like domain-containing protein [Methanomicrobiales archaeon]
MRRILLVLQLLLVLVLVFQPTACLRIVEFCPDTYLPRDADAYFVMDGVGSLSNITISDGEGSLAFPAGARIRGRVTVADEGLAYRTTHGGFPDFELKNTTPDVPDMVKTGRYAPANDGDELILFLNGTAVQSIRWPGDLMPREGQVHVLTETGWDPRILLLGQSEFSPVTFVNATVTAYVSPDSSYGVIGETVTRARQEILVNAYELTHPGIGDLLAAARQRGVQVTVLLEGGPVGGISREEAAVCAALNRSGIPLYRMTTTAAAHARYRYNHAKYLVIDGENLLISTENFGIHGYPPTGSRGNRGWGALIEDPGVAGYFREVFLADRRGGDVVPYIPSPGNVTPPFLEPYRVEFPSLRVTGVTVTPVLSPDTSGEIFFLFGRARNRIDIEQASIRNTSGGELDPFLSAAVNASRRGVAVRVLLDGSMYNDEGPADNDEMADLVNAIALGEGLPLSVRILEPEAGNLDAVHTKGIIVDRQIVMISSINWNANSPNFNREAGVILESTALGDYYSAVFEGDWSLAGKRAGLPGPDLVKIAIAGAVILVLLIALYCRKRR